MQCSPAIRPGFNIVIIGLMVLGFIVFWPLGLAMLAYAVWGHRMRSFTDGVRSGYERATGREWPMTGAWQRQAPGGWTPRYLGSGNSAFDAYRRAELERLQAERRRLDDELRDFEAHMADLRRARDKEEFDRFMAERRARRDAGQA